MLTTQRENALRSDLNRLSKSELKEMIVGNVATISGMRDLMDGARRLIRSYQNISLQTEYDPTRFLHHFTFSITDELVKSNPELTEMSAVIANHISHYIKERVSLNDDQVSPNFVEPPEISE